MKKIIGMVIASLMFANIGYAATELIAETKVQDLMHSKVTIAGDKSTKFWVDTLCVDNYKFLVARDSSGGEALSIVQFYIDSGSRGAVPAEC